MLILIFPSLNNGNVNKITNRKDITRSFTYAYDELNRRVADR